MKIAIKVDEDLPRSVVLFLRQHGYAAYGVHEQGMSGWKDESLWRAVQDEGMLLLTADKGFGDVRRYPPGTHHGVIVLRPAGPGIIPVLTLLEQILARFPLEVFRGLLVVATPHGLRLRRG